MNNTEMFSYFALAGMVVLIIGFYSIIVSNNLIRTLIGLEILTKSVTLMIIVAGYLVGQLALAQAMAITMIIIEVSLMVVAVGIVLCVFKQNKSIDAGTIKKLKG